MGILSESSSRGKKFLGIIKRFSTPLSFLFYVAGLAYFFVILFPTIVHRTYFSENALLPGLVDEEFNYENKIVDTLKVLKAVAKPPKGETYFMPVDWIRSELMKSGVETYVQNFTLKYPFAESETLEGKNVYGIVRSSRGSSNEAIVIAVPYRMDTFPAVSVLLTLAKFCREKIYWAKDLIFVFVEHSEIGMAAWLNAYHDSSHDYILYEHLVARGGAIQAAVVLDATHETFTQAEIKFNMLDGQLPNLDLVNLAVRMVEKEEIRPSVEERVEDSSLFYHEYDAYMQNVKTSLLAIARQAYGRVDGLHSLFGRFGIEALTVRTIQSKRPRSSSVGLFALARVFEGLLRSVNNLLERFHQSFFFYLMPSAHSFVSIGNYMPAIGLMIAAPLIKALGLWIYCTKAAEEEDDDGQFKESELDNTNNSMAAVAPIILLVHLLGVMVSLLPAYVKFLMANFKSESADDNLMATAFGLTIALFYFPFMLLKNRKPDTKPPTVELLRCLALLELALIVGVTSVLNFGLGFALCVSFIPAFMVAAPGKLRFLKLVILCVVNPLVGVYLYNVVYLMATSWSMQIGVGWLLMESYRAAKLSVVTIVLDSCLYNSWQFGLITYGLVPVWTLFWTLLFV